MNRGFSTSSLSRVESFSAKEKSCGKKNVLAERSERLVKKRIVRGTGSSCDVVLADVDFLPRQNRESFSEEGKFVHFYEHPNINWLCVNAFAFKHSLRLSIQPFSSCGKYFLDHCLIRKLRKTEFAASKTNNPIQS